MNPLPPYLPLVTNYPPEDVALSNKSYEAQKANTNFKEVCANKCV